MIKSDFGHALQEKMYLNIETIVFINEISV